MLRLLASVCVAVAAVATPAPAPAPAPAEVLLNQTSVRVIALPTANVGWDYQIGGGFRPAAGVGIVSRDRNDAPSGSDYSICYVNAFQTQPDEKRFWVDDPDH